MSETTPPDSVPVNVLFDSTITLRVIPTRTMDKDAVEAFRKMETTPPIRIRGGGPENKFTKCRFSNAKAGEPEQQEEQQEGSEQQYEEFEKQEESKPKNVTGRFANIIFYENRVEPIPNANAYTCVTKSSSHKNLANFLRFEFYHYFFIRFFNKS